MLRWIRNDWSMKMRETSRGEDKKLHVKNNRIQSSDRSDSGTLSRVVQSLLTWLSDKTAPVFVMATANDITKLPPELTRAGRFDEIFFVSLPAQEEREDILKIHLRKRGYTTHTDVDEDDLSKFSEDSITKLAELMQDFTGAEIEQVVAEAGRRAYADHMKGNRKVHYMTYSDIVEQIEQIVPMSKRNPEIITQLRDWAKASAKCASSQEHKNLHGNGKAKAKLHAVSSLDFDLD